MAVALSDAQKANPVTPAFSFAHVGPKEKAWQKENGREKVSRVATRDQGYAPWMGAHLRGGCKVLTHGALFFFAVRLFRLTPVLAVKASQLDRLGNVVRAYALTLVQIRDRPRYAQNAIVSSRT